MYSKLVPPSGIWKLSIYVDPVIINPIVMDIIRGIITINIKLSVYWQDFRLIIR